MLKKVINKFWFNDDERSLQIVEDEEVGFVLLYGNIIVGTLTYSENRWNFEYSNEFKIQTEIIPLVNFPQKEKVYDSEKLWPFFASRVPSSSQLMMTDDAEKTDLVELLKKYGRRTITNPFELKML
ncbi:hypothetical protein EZS27_020914 [termite gut metagenome]|uniref:HipA N-terminal subdomain 1 domain-containing protein n=1 Tax=termite gut metagenome TaxID=433724 RepID=A0A5J4RB50_9ZZZZ